jgi:hypothetical protein
MGEMRLLVSPRVEPKHKLFEKNNSKPNGQYQARQNQCEGQTSQTPVDYGHLPYDTPDRKPLCEAALVMPYSTMEESNRTRISAITTPTIEPIACALMTPHSYQI